MDNGVPLSSIIEIKKSYLQEILEIEKFNINAPKFKSISSEWNQKNLSNAITNMKYVLFVLKMGCGNTFAFSLKGDQKLNQEGQICECKIIPLFSLTRFEGSKTDVKIMFNEEGMNFSNVFSITYDKKIKTQHTFFNNVFCNNQIIEMVSYKL